MPFERILQDKVSPSDIQWNWQIQNKLQLTKRKTKRNLNQMYVKAIRVSSDNITLSTLLMQRNRAVTQEYQDDFIHISFHNLNFTDADNMNKPELTSEYIERLLKRGVFLNSDLYKFYGYSNSQLQSRSCYLRKESKALENFKKIHSFGDFVKINSVSKLAKRIGLLFSSANIFIDLDETKCKLISDVERYDLIFTDGCGCMNETFAQELSKRIKFDQKFERENKYPSVYQIRYMGYKGVLVVTPVDEIVRIYEMSIPSWKFVLKRILKYFKLQPDEIVPSILFRKSMEKFKNCSDTKNLLVVDYSKPFTYGKLNEELIILLSTIGISSKIFIDRLKHHLDLVENCTNNYEAAKKFARLKNVRIERYPRMNQQLITEMQKLQSAERSSFFDQEDTSKIKVHIVIKDSRLLFGVCDFSGKLLEGQCFVRYTESIEDESSGQMLNQKKVLTGTILVGRNPCLHPGDIQTFEAVDERHFPELKGLCDCIVFSIYGEKPASSLMSGGDLDGDRFFVCWDKQLIPSQTYPPIDYSKLQPTLRTVNFNQRNNDQLIEYFSHYNNFSLGQLKSLYLYWAKSSSNMAACFQCIKINELFSKCVDGGRIDIPRKLQKPHTPVTQPTLNPPFIMDILEEIIKTKFEPKKEETAIERQDDFKLKDVEEQEVPRKDGYFRKIFSKILEFLHIFLSNSKYSPPNIHQHHPGHYRAIQNRRVQYRPVQYRPLQYRPLQYRPVQCRPLQYRPLQCRPVQCRPLQYRPLQCRPVQYRSVHYRPVQYD